jgi:hypothetical protein
MEVLVIESHEILSIAKEGQTSRKLKEEGLQSSVRDLVNRLPF